MHATSLQKVFISKLHSLQLLLRLRNDPRPEKINFGLTIEGMLSSGSCVALVGALIICYSGINVMDCTCCACPFMNKSELIDAMFWQTVCK